jgi:hypothetical protein
MGMTNTEKFTPEQSDRYAVLARKAHVGGLSAKETAEIRRLGRLIYGPTFRAY